jgi:hypothetical protein
MSLFIAVVSTRLRVGFRLLVVRDVRLGFFDLRVRTVERRLRPRPVILETKVRNVSGTCFELISVTPVCGSSAMSVRILPPVLRASLPKALLAVRMPENTNGLSERNKPPK